jgi:hypothetical protein
MSITTHYKCSVAFKSVIKNMVTIQNIEVISQQIYILQGKITVVLLTGM